MRISAGRRLLGSRATHLAETIRKTRFKNLLGLGGSSSNHVGCGLKISPVIRHRGCDGIHDCLCLVTSWSVRGRRRNKVLLTLSLTSVDTYVETYVVGSTIVLTSVI